LFVRYREQLRAVRQPVFAGEDFDRLPGVENEEGGLRLGEALLFNEGEAKLKPEASSILDEIASLLREKYAGEMVLVEGHTDNQPLELGRRWTNMSFSQARAQAVFEYFLDHGIPESRLIVTSYSFQKPIDPETADTREGRRRNRRVVIRRGGPQI
jgi:outer membrane protein OmpA-like peptidoglycan-associated protein